MHFTKGSRVSPRRVRVNLPIHDDRYFFNSLREILTLSRINVRVLIRIYTFLINSFEIVQNDIVNERRFRSNLLLVRVASSNGYFFLYTCQFIIRRECVVRVYMCVFNDYSLL